MSHIATIDVEIKDLDALDQACRRIGLELMRGQTTHKWFRRPRKCLHAIRLPGDEDAYEIGVVGRSDGRPGYALQLDFFAGGYGLSEKIGPKGGLLTQAYAVEVARKQAASSGFTVNEQRQPDGSIVLRCVR